LPFGGTNHEKEQVVTSAVAVLGVVTFSTHRPTPPSPNNCGSNLGEARVYNLGFLDGSPAGTNRFAVITGGGLPPSPVAGMVTVNVPSKGLITVPFVIGANPDSPLEGKSPVPIATPANFKTRAYWLLEQ
ncbi:MAG: pilus assembly protein PilY, partial [Nitrosomonas sp.]|nr:pilus assembly protein PilY [Nitrosomonas sp.]